MIKNTTSRDEKHISDKHPLGEINKGQKITEKKKSVNLKTQ